MNEETARRVGLVTGGSRGIGRGIVEELARSGWDVAFTYKDSQATADEVVERLGSCGARVMAFRADVVDFERAGLVVEEVEKSLGPIQLLVNNAGIKWDVALFRMTPAQWREVVETNLDGTFNYSRSVIFGMIRRKSGVIVNIVSVSGIVGLAGQTNYSASKAGIIGFTKALSREVARFNVRVNAVAPGYIETDMLSDLPEAVRKRMSEQIPQGGPGSPRDVARVVAFLASDGARYVTGQVLPVDGGMV